MRIGPRWLESGDHFRQHASQHIRRGPDLLVLEHVNQVAQTTLIASIGGSSRKRRLQALAKPTARFPMLAPKGVRRNQAFPAYRAKTAFYGVDGLEANLANRKA